MAIASVPTVEPTSFYAGDSLTWKIENSDYKASDGWTLQYILLKSDTQIVLTSTADGDDHLIEVAKAVTAEYDPGSYSWRAYFYDADERYAYKSGEMKVELDWSDESSGSDVRSHAKIVLDAIEALIQGKSLSTDQMSIKIGDREISRLSPKQLTEWRNFYKSEYQQELNEQALDNGDTTNNQTLYGKF